MNSAIKGLHDFLGAEPSGPCGPLLPIYSYLTKPLLLLSLAPSTLILFFFFTYLLNIYILQGFHSQPYLLSVVMEIKPII